MVDVDAFNLTYQITAILLTVGSIGGLIWQLGRWINSRAEVKAKTLQDTTERIAMDIKHGAEERAINVKETTQQVLEKMKDEATERDVKIREYVTNLAEQYREVNAKHITDLEAKVTEINSSTA